MKNIIFILCILSTTCSQQQIVSKYSLSNKFTFDNGRYFSNSKLRVSFEPGSNPDRDIKKRFIIDKQLYLRDKGVIERFYPKFNLQHKNFLITTAINDTGYFHNHRTSVYVFPKQIGVDTILKLDTIKGCLTQSNSGNTHTYISIQCSDIYVDNQNEKHLQSLGFINYHNGIGSDSFKFDDAYYVHKPNTDYPYEFLSNDLDSANYFKTLAVLKNYKASNATREGPWKYDPDYKQTIAMYNTMVQNNTEYTTLYNELYKKGKEVDPNRILYKNTATLSFIEQACRNKQVVLLNEMPIASKYRYLVNQLLTQLYNTGFRYLAIETLADDSLMMRKYPLQSSGVYTRDPIFANTIRHAIQLGYTVIGYDSISKQQSHNIFSKTLQQNPQAKLLVYTQHGFKKNDQTQVLANEFRVITGNKPLIINQTEMEASAQLMGADDVWILKSKSKKYDILLVNNYQYPKIVLAPNSTTQSYQFKLSQLGEIKLKQHTQLLVSVFVRDEFLKESFKAIPVLNYMIYKDKPFTLRFDLPKGNYTFIVRTFTGYVAQQVVLK